MKERRRRRRRRGMPRREKQKGNNFVCFEKVVVSE